MARTHGARSFLRVGSGDATTSACSRACCRVGSATTASVSGNTLTVEGKEAGLGDEAQIHVVLSATALCINGGGNHPKAVNKESVNAAADFPVQNGKADWTLSVAAVFQPSCDPPMTVAFTDITVTDTTNGLTLNIPGTF